jgi:hypothetical protein
MKCQRGRKMDDYAVDVQRTTYYKVRTTSQERAVDLVLGWEEPEPGEAVEEVDGETTGHGVHAWGEGEAPAPFHGAGRPATLPEGGRMSAEQADLKLILNTDEQLLLKAFLEKVGYWGHETPEDLFAHRLYAVLKTIDKREGER